MIATEAQKTTVEAPVIRHSHYSRDDFFRFSSEHGSIHDFNGRRNLLAGEDFILALQIGLEKEAGPASALLMYMLGQRWGERDFEHFSDWFEPEFKTPIEEANLKFLLETWWWPFTAQGWGKWELETPEGGYMIVNLYDSAVAKTLGNLGKPVCHLYAGLFAGCFSRLFKKELSGIEIQCYAMGESHCKFLLGAQERVDAAEFWLGNGSTAREVVTLLEEGEDL